ncbi:MAG TPA: MFS transporter [Vicinamibacterales bacterium]|nr:MFS transporter [Vicinamibacterales bacterium]
MSPRAAAGRLRWGIAALLFLSTVVNYIDRQTLNVLAPHLKTAFGWSNADFAWVVIAFRVAYGGGQMISGRLLDRLGTRAGLSLTVACYSTIAALTSLATGLRSFAAFRFLLGAAESANWPGATKAVAEWFPRRESGWAVALFDSGSSIGAAIAPALVLAIFHLSGNWRPAFIVTGALGFAWVGLFHAIYRSPEDHPRLSADERSLILTGRGGGADSTLTADAPATPTYGALLRLPQTWGIVLGKALTDPVWFFITDWFAIYLVSRGFRLEDSLLAFWVPFLAADLGNFFGGGCSSALIARGWPVGSARKLVIAASAAAMTLLIPAAYATSLVGLTSCLAIATFAYAALSTMILNLPADLYPTGSVASVSGLSGTGAGVGTVLATYLTGIVADRYSFRPVLIVASAIPIAAAAAILILVRNNRATSRGLVYPI